MIFNYNDKHVYYEVHGTGKPLLFLNGIMMSTKSWAQFVKPLSLNNQLILVDFLDQGQSSTLEGMEYNHSIQVEMIEAFIDYLNLEKIHLFGVSYGGEIAIQVGQRIPDRIEKLLLFNTCGETTYWLQEVGNAWNEAAINGLSYYLTTIPVIYSPKFFTQNREWIENRKKVLLPIFSNPQFIGQMKRLTNSSLDYNAMESMSKITAKTLIVGCEYDFVTPYYQQEDLNKAIVNSELVFIPESGHALFYEKPTVFLSLVLGFVSSF